MLAVLVNCTILGSVLLECIVYNLKWNSSSLNNVCTYLNICLSSRSWMVVCWWSHSTIARLKIMHEQIQEFLFDGFLLTEIKWTLKLFSQCYEMQCILNIFNLFQSVRLFVRSFTCARHWNGHLIGQYNDVTTNKAALTCVCALQPAIS